MDSLSLADSYWNRGARGIQALTRFESLADDSKAVYLPPGSIVATGRFVIELGESDRSIAYSFGPHRAIYQAFLQFTENCDIFCESVETLFSSAQSRFRRSWYLPSDYNYLNLIADVKVGVPHFIPFLLRVVIETKKHPWFLEWQACILYRHYPGSELLSFEPGFYPYSSYSSIEPEYDFVTYPDSENEVGYYDE